MQLDKKDAAGNSIAFSVQSASNDPGDFENRGQEAVKKLGASDSIMLLRK